MSNVPWAGAARPLPAGAMADAARLLACEPEALEAVWEVESGGRCFLPDRSVIRRFEPHKMPGATTNWRDSLKIGPAERERMFSAAYRAHPIAALNATSWGAPQIMGSNHIAAGLASARDMVEAFAAGADAHLAAFASFIQRNGLSGALRARDWLTFAQGYNGSGQPEVYAARMEAAYRRISGKASPEVLRIGARGEAVRRLQAALDIEADGSFGPETEAAVEVFQRERGLIEDGVVGAMTWEALEKAAQVKPVKQPASVDRFADTVAKAASVASAVSVAASGVREVLPETAYHVLSYGAVALALIAGAAFAVRYIRRTAL